MPAGLVKRCTVRQRVLPRIRMPIRAAGVVLIERGRLAMPLMLSCSPLCYVGYCLSQQSRTDGTGQAYRLVLSSSTGHSERLPGMCPGMKEER